jgi:hypothetical protein
MATRKVPEGDKPQYEVPEPMEPGDPRTVPAVGADPHAPESSDLDTRIDEAVGNTSSSDSVSVSAFGVHVGSGVPVDEMEAVPDGWDRNADGSMTPNTVPWAGY